MVKIVAEIKSISKLTAEISTGKKLNAQISNTKFVIDGAEPYKGEYTVTPKAFASTTLKTKDKVLKEDVSVFEIPYFDVSNESGTTIYIGSEVNLNGD